jgi:hypothetical protein
VCHHTWLFTIFYSNNSLPNSFRVTLRSGNVQMHSLDVIPWAFGFLHSFLFLCLDRLWTVFEFVDSFFCLTKSQVYCWTADKIFILLMDSSAANTCYFEIFCIFVILLFCSCVFLNSLNNFMMVILNNSSKIFRIVRVRFLDVYFVSSIGLSRKSGI